MVGVLRINSSSTTYKPHGHWVNVLVVSLCTNWHGANSHGRIVGRDDAHTVMSIVLH